MNSTLNTWQIWRAPILLGILSIIGLISALLADGFGDLISWLMLSIPVGVIIWYAVARQSDKKS